VFGHSTLSAELVEHTIGIKKNGRFSRRCGEGVSDYAGAWDSKDGISERNLLGNSFIDDVQ
jgi:hypothetical protein